MEDYFELYKKLLADYEEVSRKLMHYQSNAYHWHDKVAVYEKAWAEIELSHALPAVNMALNSTVELSDVELSDKAKKRLRKSELEE